MDQIDQPVVDRRRRVLGEAAHVDRHDPVRELAHDDRAEAPEQEMEAQLGDVQADFEGSFNAQLATGGIRGVVGEGD